VVTFTVNHQAWTPTMTVPFVVCVVELAEQPGLQVVANLGGDPGGVRIGMAVRVRFEQVDDVWFPVFVSA